MKPHGRPLPGHRLEPELGVVQSEDLRRERESEAQPREATAGVQLDEHRPRALLEVLSLVLARREESLWRALSER